MIKAIIKQVAALALVAVYTQVSAQDISVDDYRIAAGDEVRVEVYGHGDLSGDCVVDGSGHCSLPLIKSVDAAGLTSTELEERITDRLKPDYLKDPIVSVEMLAYRPIYVLGEVRNPGSYPYTAGMTLVKAIAHAGGFTHRASRKKITVIKAGEETSDKQVTQEDHALSPGDVIEVPERFF